MGRFHRPDPVSRTRPEGGLRDTRGASLSAASSLGDARGGKNASATFSPWDLSSASSRGPPAAQFGAKRAASRLGGNSCDRRTRAGLPNAFDSLPHASEVAEVELDQQVRASLERLSRLLDAGPGDPLWDDKALDWHPAWAEARALAREVLSLLPSPDSATWPQEPTER